MAEETNQDVARLIAGLNDLLQLDNDAVQAYTVAIESLEGEQFRSAVRMFRGDHERHIADLSALVRARNGTPSDLPHIPTGMFKLAVQKAAAAAGGDREILLAFKANEGQARDKYRRAAADMLPPDVSSVIRRNAADEERHYAWVTQALEVLGAGRTTAAGKVEAGFETVHARTADAIEAGEQEVMMAAQGAKAKAGELGERARELAANAGDRAMSAAGGGLEGAGRGLDRAADWVDERGGVASKAAAPVHRFAGVLQQEGGHLRQQDMDAVKRDVEGGVRAHPIRSVLLVAGIGFVIGRMIR